MKKPRFNMMWSGLLTVCLALSGAGCDTGSDSGGDAGTDTSIAGTESGGDSGNGDSGNGDSGNDGTVTGDSGNDGTVTGDSGNDGTVTGDSGNGDSGNGDSGNGDSGNDGTVTGDSGNDGTVTGDSGTSDIGTGDSGNDGTVTGDSGNDGTVTGDTGTSDIGTGDSGNDGTVTGDSGTSDIGTGDSGNDDTISVDTGSGDTDTGDTVVCEPDSVGSAEDDTRACLKAVSCLGGTVTGNSTALVCLFGNQWYSQDIFEDWAGTMMAKSTYDFYDVVRENAACVAEATDCEGVFSCVNGGEPSGDCEIFAFGVGGGETCADDVLTGCVPTSQSPDPSSYNFLGREYKRDCGALGQGCSEVTLTIQDDTDTDIAYVINWSVCGEGDCPAFDIGDRVKACDGDKLEMCPSSPGSWTVDCAAFSGGTCGLSEGGPNMGCIPAGDACDDAVDVDYCTGDILTECEDGFWHDRDCAAEGSMRFCEEDDYGANCYTDIAVLDTCTLNISWACNCDDIVFCDPFSGGDTRLSCPDLGFETCTTITDTDGDTEIGCI